MQFQSPIRTRSLMPARDQHWMHLLLRDLCRKASAVVEGSAPISDQISHTSTADLQALERSLADLLAFGRSVRPDAFGDGA